MYFDEKRQDDHYMVQYGVWSNCCNDCDFCLRLWRTPLSKAEMLHQLDMIKQNIDYIDWKNKFSYGISLLGGEMYHITDPELQESFLELIDIIIEKILKVSPNPDVKYSTVTNGLYDPTFLFKVIDKIVNAVGKKAIDVNFSYDLKYRFHTEERRKLCLENINKFHERYNYNIGVQMILTQYLIDMVKNGEFSITEFLDKEIPGNTLTFLYPHPVNTGLDLPDFNFKRSDFLNFMLYLSQNYPLIYKNFCTSTHNSAIFKYTGFFNKNSDDVTQQPLLTDGKQLINEKCGHSILYQCYSDSDACIVCDLDNLNI
jgi:hypothetical protein